ncbi:hypothetical protein HZH68_016906 [Vespula germanica]|uniref:Uncharacterized protein n=1 Tax=Vespula germanica TaxID=30212 RepID=A0A834J138_VESGE|nr:hypothetical protein HZH68_016906 [Vespula germanica]
MIREGATERGIELKETQRKALKSQVLFAFNRRILERYAPNAKHLFSLFREKITRPFSHSQPFSLATHSDRENDATLDPGTLSTNYRDKGTLITKETDDIERESRKRP